MNVKLLGTQTIIYSVSGCCLRAASLLLIPLYTHYFTMEEYGKFAILQSITAIFLVFMSAGIRDAFVRALPESTDPKKSGFLFGASICGVLVQCLIVLVIVASISGPAVAGMLHLDQSKGLLVLCCMIALTQSAYTLSISYFRAQAIAIKFMWYSLTAALVMIFLGYLFVVILHQGLFGALLAQLISYGAVFLLASVKDILPRVKLGVAGSYLRRITRNSLPLILSSTATYLMDSGAIFILSYYGRMESLAIYAIGQKIAALVVFIYVNPFLQSLGPMIYSHSDFKKVQEKFAKVLVLYLLLGTFGLIALGNMGYLFIPLACTKQYGPSYFVAIGLVSAYLVNGLIDISKVLLQYSLNNNTIGIISVVMLGCSAACNLLMIPLLGLKGAVGANLATFGIGALLYGGMAIRKNALRIAWRKIGLCAALYGAVALGMLAVGLGKPGPLSAMLLFSGIAALAALAYNRCGIIGRNEMRRIAAYGTGLKNRMAALRGAKPVLD